MWLVTASTGQKMKFCIKETADLVTFTEEILNGKLHFLCSALYKKYFKTNKGQAIGFILLHLETKLNFWSII